MIIAGIVVFSAIALGLIVLRKQFAELQSMLFGATLPIGCVWAQALMFLLMAAVIYFYREWFE